MINMREAEENDLISIVCSMYPCVIISDFCSDPDPSHPSAGMGGGFVDIRTGESLDTSL